MNKPLLLICKTAFARSLALALVCAAPAVSAQSIWNANSKSMYSDKRATMVGDILNVLIQESNTANRQNNTKTAKSSNIDASIQSFLYAPAASGLLTKKGQLPALKTTAAQSFDGGGQINNSEKISARIAVRIIDTLPNGNLVIEGTRKVSFSGETQDAVLRGVVRVEDVMANNTIYSYSIADATIKYVSTGTLSDNQKKGWFTRVFEKITPF
jgi:flagellar L-ring protein precursor FlgH